MLCWYDHSSIARPFFEQRNALESEATCCGGLAIRKSHSHGKIGLWDVVANGDAGFAED